MRVRTTIQWYGSLLGTLAVTQAVLPLPTASAQGPASAALLLDQNTALKPINGRVLWVEHRGRHALKLAPLEGQESATDQEISALIVGSDFGDGVIELDVSGARRRGYATDDGSAFKGFIGVSFRVRGDSAERFYVRPENARHESEVFRNRSIQYESSPDHPWQRLRQERPGVYEAHADMSAGDWTHLRIEVEGTVARLYVNRAPAPALVVTDLRLGRSRGAIALWTRISSDAYFADLRVEPKE
jgi:hypothetical protein